MEFAELLTLIPQDGMNILRKKVYRFFTVRSVIEKIIGFRKCYLGLETGRKVLAVGLGGKVLGANASCVRRWEGSPGSRPGTSWKGSFRKASKGGIRFRSDSGYHAKE